MADLIPNFEHTQIDTIASTVSRLRSTFRSQKTKPIEFRLVQLRKLWWGIQDNEPAILEACKRDLGKPTLETYAGEIDWCKNDIVFICDNLKKWAKDETAPDMPLTNRLMRPKIRKDPLGVVLVIGTYNFPIQLCLGPVIGAIAAGNTVLLKPSEQAPSCATVIQKIIETSLDPSCYACVQGAIPETTTLLDQKWDKILYTGSGNVAKIIAKKAAETLTPVALELGGRNPAFVTKNADIKLAAKRLLWGKTYNAGQVCISENYVLIDKDVVPTFVDGLKQYMKEFFPDGPRSSPDFGRIVSERQWKRLKSLIDESRGKILIGGLMDEEDRYFEPTVVQVDDIDDCLIREETFGPIITILPVTNLDEAIRFANEIDSTPLGAYPFGSKVEIDRIMREVQSGGATINDAWFHGSMSRLAFGGVGSSGTGAYRGKASFDCFTHRRSFTQTPNWMEGMLKVRYPPSVGNLEKLQKMNNLAADFDRNGKVKANLVKWILSLGADSSSGSFVRYAAILLVGAVIRQYLERKS